MKITRTLVILIVCVIVLSGGVYYYFSQNKAEPTDSKQNSTAKSATEKPNKKDVREAVWEQLTDRQKTSLKGTWSDGTAAKTTIKKGSAVSYVGESYEGKEVYALEFPRKSSDTLGDTLPIFADVDTYKLIGYGLLD